MGIGFLSYGDENAKKSSLETTVLKERVAERWGAISAYDFLKAYEYQSPEYKKVFPRELYVSSFSRNIVWKYLGVNVLKVDETSGVATVEIELETSSADPALHGSAEIVTSKITEKWLHIAGQWWHSSGT